MAFSYWDGVGPSVAFRFASRMTSEGRGFLLALLPFLLPAPDVDLGALDTLL